MSTFFLAMVAYPDIQIKAREEIDRVVGTHRLPTFTDRPNLPYIEAILKEVLRFQPVGPMGLPHVTTKDDIVNGYRIPQGAILLANIWFVEARIWNFQS
jgi:cytochrome P450